VSGQGARGGAGAAALCCRQGSAAAAVEACQGCDSCSSRGVFGGGGTLGLFLVPCCSSSVHRFSVTQQA
jgi:hypothetical protein